MMFRRRQCSQAAAILRLWTGPERSVVIQSVTKCAVCYPHLVRLRAAQRSLTAVSAACAKDSAASAEVTATRAPILPFLGQKGREAVRRLARPVHGHADADSRAAGGDDVDSPRPHSRAA
eukprot:6208414-Pleurochrysis_carterae.AAC.3